MIRRIIVASCLCLAAVYGSFAQQPREVAVSLNPSARCQTLEGWGSSLCWWAAQVGKWDDRKIEEVLDLITSPDKLNMNIFRYNIGGGDDPAHADGHMVKGKGKRAEMEGFKPSANTPYNWEADAGQRKILLQLKKKRKDALFEAFSNSAPYWMTYSGCAAGNDDASKDNLKPEYYGAFCDYLLEVCKHYKKRYAVDFRTLEPFNESLSSYWYNQGTQEGCHFEPQSQMKLIRMLYPKLMASGLKTRLASSDETCLLHTLKVERAYEQAGDIWDKMEQMNTHTYSGTNEERKQVRQVAERFGKRFWQSETGPSGGAGLESNLLLTQKMFDDLKIMQPVAWLDWQLMEEKGAEWCVLRGNFKTQDFVIVKNFYVRMQITRFFRRGYTLMDVTADHVLAAVSPKGKECVFAILNSETQAMPYGVDLSMLPGLKQLRAWRTSEKEDCAPLQVSIPASGVLHYTAPAQSLTTFVICMR